MKIYSASVILHGHDYFEDPDCPISWRGSGVYDVCVGYDQKAFASVVADSEEQATELVENYDYNRLSNCSMIVDVVEIDDIEFVGEVTDGGDPEVYDISIFDAEYVGRL